MTTKRILIGKRVTTPKVTIISSHQRSRKIDTLVVTFTQEMMEAWLGKENASSDISDWRVVLVEDYESGIFEFIATFCPSNSTEPRAKKSHPDGVRFLDSKNRAEHSEITKDTLIGTIKIYSGFSLWFISHRGFVSITSEDWAADSSIKCIYIKIPPKFLVGAKVKAKSSSRIKKYVKKYNQDIIDPIEARDVGWHPKPKSPEPSLIRGLDDTKVPSLQISRDLDNALKRLNTLIKSLKEEHHISTVLLLERDLSGTSKINTLILEMEISNV